MKMGGLLVNIDVGDLAAAERFYCAALGLTAGRRFEGAVELLGLDAPLYLLAKAAVGRARVAGAALEKDIAAHEWGRIALLADPFGNGFCFVEFSARGYDAIAL